MSGSPCGDGSPGPWPESRLLILFDFPPISQCRGIDSLNSKTALNRLWCAKRSRSLGYRKPAAIRRSIHVPQDSPQTSLHARVKSEDGHCTKGSLILKFRVDNNCGKIISDKKQNSSQLLSNSTLMHSHYLLSTHTFLTFEFP